MEQKDIWLITIAFLGWTWGIIQLIINRRNQRKDKLIDRRFEAYSSYMKKSDELMNNVRTDPNMIFGISSEFMTTVMTGDSDQINDALAEFNKKLLDFVKKSSEPLMILKQELNSLLIICSDSLSAKIDELILLTTDFNNEMKKTLSLISPNESNSRLSHLETLGHDKRWLLFGELNKEIIKLMREELGSK